MEAVPWSVPPVPLTLAGTAELGGDHHHGVLPLIPHALLQPGDHIVHDAEAIGELAPPPPLAGRGCRRPSSESTAMDGPSGAVRNLAAVTAKAFTSPPPSGLPPFSILA